MKKKFIILVLLITFILSFTQTSLAKYAYKKINNLYLESHNFYFESDILGFNNKYTDTLWDGKSVHFNLSNSVGEKVNDSDILYEVKCEVLNEDVPCSLNGTGKSKITGTLSHSEACISDTDTLNYNKTECELNGYNWVKSKSIQDIYFDVFSNNPTVLVTITSTYPYKKVLSTTFSLIKNIKDNGSLKKELNVMDDRANLIITNTYIDKKCVLVEFNNNNSLVDLTSDMLDIKTSGEYVNAFKINIDGMSNQKVTFYKKNINELFSIDNYKISVSSGCS